MEVVASGCDNGVTESMDYKVNELLKEVQLDFYSTTVTKFVDDVVSSIREVIENIPQDLKVGQAVAPGFVRDIGADKFEFTFRKPLNVEIGGSYSIQSVAKPDTSIDLFIRLPKECFNEKDYLNHRYHAKRCLYLCVIKKYLIGSSLIKKIEWSTFQNEARKPVLLVYPVQELVEIPGFLIRLIPTATSLFSIPKLNMTRSNLRALNQDGSVPEATPRYNSSILEDMSLEENTEFVKKTFLGWKELRDALILTKVWARHRTSIYAHDCLNGFLLSVILSYLATESGGNRINRSMNTMQIFRVTLDFIANSKLWDKGLLLQVHSKRNLSKEERRQYQQLFPVVLYDSSSQLNLAFRITMHGFSELRDEAALTLNCINKCRGGGFEEVFMTKVDIPAKFDYCLRIKMETHKEVYASGFCLDQECWRTYEEKVHSLLEQGLGDRVKCIRVTWRSNPSEWKIEEGFSKLSSNPLLVGILTSSPEKIFRGVDIGPNAENKIEVLKYRKFWGEKAELRRFKDGTIAESTVWDCQQWERHLIVKRISEYVLSRHLALSKESMTHVADQLDFCLLRGAGDSISFHGSLLGAFEVLSKRLRGMEDIPLRVSSVQPLDSAFRSTSVFLPEPHPLANEKGKAQRSQKLVSTCIKPMEVMIQLEGSGNWPMDDVAMEKTKSAFLLKIGESLQKSWGMPCIASEDELDVFISGYAFRLRILHERGLGLLRKQVGKKRITSVDKKLFLRGQHSSMINGLVGRYPIYSPVVRLAKRWISSHLFSSFLEEEAVELLVAYLFLRPLPFCAPCSRITGFLRFLRLLSNYDWTFSPLIVDINGDMTPKDEKEITENFMASRKIYEENPQNLETSMFIATSYDKSSEAWTKFSPNSSELRRMVAYARSSAEFLTNLIVQNQIDSQRWECLFRTPLSNYDAVILLHRDKLPFPQHLLFPSEMNQGKHVAEGKANKEFNPLMVGRNLNLDQCLVNFDPLQCLVKDLKEEFSDTFKLWYDSIGGDAVGLTWNKLESKKRVREDDDDDTGEEERRDPIDVLKNVGKVGKGFVRSVYLLKNPKLIN